MADPTSRLLAADLDGTLHNGDLAWHCCMQLLTQQPWLLPQVLGWTFQSRLRLKNELATRVTPKLAELDWLPEVITFLRAANAADRPLALATAATAKHAQLVVKYLAAEHGVKFDYVVASTAQVNLHGRAKAAALVQLGGVGGFDYIGDSPRQDPPVFSAAHISHLVNPTAALRQEYASADSRIFTTQLGLGAKLRRRLLARIQAGS